MAGSEGVDGLLCFFQSLFQDAVLDFEPFYGLVLLG
jgi:hypothetical protein